MGKYVLVPREKRMVLPELLKKKKVLAVHNILILLLDRTVGL